MSALSDFRWMEMTYFPWHWRSTVCLIQVILMVVAERAQGFIVFKWKTFLSSILILIFRVFTTVSNLEDFQCRPLKCSFKLTREQNTIIYFLKVLSLPKCFHLLGLANVSFLPKYSFFSYFFPLYLSAISFKALIKMFSFIYLLAYCVSFPE